MRRAVGVLPVDAAPTDPAAAIATAALRTLAATAALPAARAALLAAQLSAAPSTAPALTPTAGATAAAGHVQLPLLLHDLLRCCVLTRCPAAADAAIVCVGQLAADAALQVGCRGATAGARVPGRPCRLPTACRV